MLKTMFFFQNGNFAACDGRGEQVGEEQGCAWLVILQDKLKRGVVNRDTEVNMAGWPEQPTTVGALIDNGRLTL